MVLEHYIDALMKADILWYEVDALQTVNLV
jgi:hypothetical protein